jgi:AcrR family transcriptional regulator
MRRSRMRQLKEGLTDSNNRLKIEGRRSNPYTFHLRGFTLMKEPRVPEHSHSGESRASSVENTRSSLMQAARKLFAAKGFDAATVKEIADAAGVNVSLVNYHFNGKEGLYRTCIETYGKTRLAVAQRILKPARSLEEFRIRLKMFVEEFFQLHLAEPECCLILTRDVSMESPLCEDIFRSTFLIIFDTLVNFVVDGKDMGFLREDCEERIAASILFGAMVHMLRNDRISQKFFQVSLYDDGYREKVVRELMDVFFRGLLPAEVR